MRPLVPIALLLILPVLSGFGQCNFTLAITPVEVRCFGESNGEATVTITPGNLSTAPYEVQWFDGYDQLFRDDLPAGTHFVKVTDSYGCFVNAFVTIDQPARLTAAPTITDVRCFAAAEGRIALTVEGGSAPYRYAWSNGETTKDVAALTAGTYGVTVTDARGCTVEAGGTVTQPEELRISPSVRAVSCHGGRDGILRVTAFGGVQPYRYSWSTADTIPEVFDLPAGVHTLTLTDAHQCVHIADLEVPQPAPLAVDFQVKKVSCFDLPDGEIIATVTGGTPDYRYRWSNDAFVLGDTTFHPINLYRDDYTLEVTDANGCELVDSVRVEEPNPLVIHLEATDATCFNKPDGAIDLSVSGGTSPYAVLWSTDARTEDIDGLLSEQYQVVVADLEGCTRYGEISVGQPDSLDFRVVVDAVSCKDETDGRITLRPAGGTPGYTVRWSHGESSFRIDELPGATYTVTLTDAQACAYTASFDVPVNPEACITPVGVPNTFTPNGDAYNDLWVLRHHEEYPDIEVAVFNKWGEQVFYSKGYEVPWNGTQDGRLVQPGTYYYTIRLNNGDAPFSGTLTIIR